MANEEQLSILKQGVDVWNEWRKKSPNVIVNLWRADLTGANLGGANLHNAQLRKAYLSGADLNGANLTLTDLTGADLSGANLIKANLCQASLNGAILRKANLSEADLTEAHLPTADLIESRLEGAKLIEANLSKANLSRANLSGADLRRANLGEAELIGSDLSGADLTFTYLEGADLSQADLTGASLVSTMIDRAKISGSFVYAISVWDLDGEFQEQKDIVITREGQPVITVDNIEIAQFIYLILNNEKVRDVINTLTSKSVLILGRFTPERKVILDTLRDQLREYDLLPIVFDFDRPTDKDFTETVKTLAGLSYFVIADITNPKSSPLELQATVPDYQIPFVPIIQEGEKPFAMMVDLQKKYSWVLPTRSYDSIETLMAALKPGIIDPAVEMKNKLRLLKAQERVTESLKDYLDKTL